MHFVGLGAPLTVSSKYSDYTVFPIDGGYEKAYFAGFAVDDLDGFFRVISRDAPTTPYKPIVTDNFKGSLAFPEDWKDFNKPAKLTLLDQAISYLRARGIPPFEIPRQYGGGQRYLVIVPEGTLRHSSVDDEEVLYVQVSFSLLLNAFYPHTLVHNGKPYLPVYPYTAAPVYAVMGYPGVFRFVPER